MSTHIPTQADFDLERVMDMFDQALTSKDERVINALRSLLMIVTLTAPEGEDDVHGRSGPFRQLQEDIRNLSRRVGELEGQLNRVTVRPVTGTGLPSNPYSNPGSPYPTTTTGPWWGVTPGSTTYSTSNPSSSVSLNLSSSDLDAILDKTTMKITK